ncbi:MAG: flocculation-associated PEP-CTERM protein PepA [Noviherbaspirillum sp.]
MKNVFSRTLLACAITGTLAMASSTAMAQSFPDFTINEGAIPGAVDRTLTADKITGNFVEVIDFTPGTTPGSGTFNASLLWNAGQFVGNNGASPTPSQLGGITPNQYGMYALYKGTGTFTTAGVVTTFTFTPGGSLEVFADPGSDTTFITPGNGSTAFGTGGTTGDDYLLASGMPQSGEGSLNPTLSTCSGGTVTSGINCGSFGASSSFNVTTAGGQFFAAPNPFYNLSFQSGQLNNFSPTGVQVINGSLDVIFGGGGGGEVPEPGTVALFGLGILGLGLASRRRKVK